MSVFLVMTFLLLLVFGFAYTWKAQEVARLCTRLDNLRNQQKEMKEHLKALQISFHELTTYSKIEPLASHKLGMHPSPTPPVIIAPLDDHFAVFKAEYRKPTDGSQE